MLKQLSVITIALLATQANAAPAANQAFVTFGLGQSNYSEVNDFCTNEIGLSCDDKDTAFRIGAGIALSPMYNVELTYINHGEVGGTYAEPGFNGSIDMKADTFAVQASAQTSIAPQLSVYGKAGLALTNATVDYQENDMFGSYRETDDSDSTGLILSIGAEYAAMPNVMANIQLDFLPDAIEYKEANFESDITMISLGLKYQF